MSLPESDQTPLPYKSYRRVRRLRRPGPGRRLRNYWKRLPNRTKRTLFKMAIGVFVTVMAVLMAVPFTTLI
jgi:hypothetical protein